jgi:hypothetical protein
VQVADGGMLWLMKHVVADRLPPLAVSEDAIESEMDVEYNLHE